MSLLTKSDSSVGTGLVTLPRVNLLPPEIAEAKRFRRIQVGLGAAVVATLGAVGLALVAATGSVDAANTELEAASADGARLQSESAKYRDVTAVYQQAAAAQAMLTEAMGEEVRYSRLLSDLSLSVPENVWLGKLNFAQAPVDPALGSTEPGVAVLTVEGKGFSHDDVALWLESLAAQSTFTNPYFSKSEESLVGTRAVVDFSSTSTLTPAALSGRYTTPAGG